MSSVQSLCSMSPEYKVIKECVQSAIERVYENDRSLIIRDANERSIVFRFGVYLCEMLKTTVFRDCDVDVEYNRNGYDPKRIPSRQSNGAVPDLIIHKRESNNYNILVLEFKTERNRNNQNQSEDKKKIEELTSTVGEYRFRYGATILIGYEEPTYTLYGQI